MRRDIGPVTMVFAAQLTGSRTIGHTNRGYKSACSAKNHLVKCVTQGQSDIEKFY